jgi:hypothetical protein
MDSSLEEIFGPAIVTYTQAQAIEDGFLHEPYPDRFPQLLISNNIAEACENDPDRTFDQACIPLLIDVAMAAKVNKKKLLTGDFVELTATIAGAVWVRVNETGGLTVCQPIEN